MENLIILIGIPLFFYFGLIRPQQKQQKERSEMLKNLEAGDVINTIGGIRAAVVSLGDETLKVEISEGVIIEILRSAVGTVVTEEEEDEEEYEEDETAAEEEEETFEEEAEEEI